MGMISVINIQCPHCLRDNAVLKVLGDVKQPRKGTRALFAMCQSCEGALVVEAFAKGSIVNFEGGFIDFSNSYKSGVDIDGNVRGETAYAKTTRCYPVATTPSAPADTPLRIARFFIEAGDNFQREKFETCGALCRKVIDIATRHLAEPENISAWKLGKRIDELKTNGLITKEMAEWAHIVRLDGNEQTHTEDEFDRDSAEAVLDFTETFLLYAFTLPAMVKAKNSRMQITRPGRGASYLNQ